MRLFSLLGLLVVILAFAIAAVDAVHARTIVDPAWTRLADFIGIGSPAASEMMAIGEPSRKDGWALFLEMPLWLAVGYCGIALSLVFRPERAVVPAEATLASRAGKNGLSALGLGCLIGSLIGALYAFSQAMQTQTAPLFMTFGQVWQQLHPSSVNHTVSWLAHASSPWRQIIEVPLGLPVLLIGGVVGLALYHAAARAGRREHMAGESTASQSSDAPAQTARQASQQSTLTEALTAYRSAFLSIGLLSGMSNVLMLTGAFFMLQIYDRVLPSRSVPTLLALAILVAFLFASLAIIDLIRSRILIRIGTSLDETLNARVYQAIVQLPLKTQSRGDGLQPLRDLDTVRGFMAGTGPGALFDLPWMPIYMAVIFSFHTVLGLTASFGALILIVLTLITEILTRAPLKAAAHFAQARHGLAEASRRNAEAVAAMGMAGRLQRRWAQSNEEYIASSQQVSDVGGGFGSVSKALRMLLQSAVLGVGAYLVINQSATAGVIIAAAILVARALAPVDLAIANWKGFVAARQSWNRLNQILAALPVDEDPMALPPPNASLSVEHASAVPPGSRKAVVQDVTFALKCGQGLGIIGPSASGKSSLVRMIVGAWTPARGRIRLDGAALDQWSQEDLGHHIGYLPQDVELFAGTVAENIARFDTAAQPAAIIAAAQAAGVHEMIVALPKGYETEIGEQGQVLSAGQRQRVGLARALYGAPFLVVLDEPNSNLDSDGEAALTGALNSVRERGGIVIVVAHRPSALSALDSVLVMAKGRTVTFGPKEEVLPKFLAPTVVSPPATPKVVKSETQRP